MQPGSRSEETEGDLSPRSHTHTRTDTPSHASACSAQHARVVHPVSRLCSAISSGLQPVASTAFTWKKELRWKKGTATKWRYVEVCEWKITDCCCEELFQCNSHARTDFEIRQVGSESVRKFRELRHWRKLVDYSWQLGIRKLQTMIKTVRKQQQQQQKTERQNSYFHENHGSVNFRTFVLRVSDSSMKCEFLSYSEQCWVK